MKSRRESLRRSRIYVIIDKEISKSRPLTEIARKLTDSGVDIIQLRDKVSGKDAALKDALLLRKLLSGTKALFIVNDFADIARIADSDGLHLGADDISVGIARKLLGKDKIIGKSCHSIKQAFSAQKEGADYISVGPVFKTPLKPGYKPVGLRLVREAGKKIRIPFFAIGGINEDNLHKVKSAGTKRVVVCRAVCRSKDIAKAVRKLSKGIN